MDEGFHNVLSAICSETWILWCLNKLCAVQRLMINFTSVSVLWSDT